MRPNSQQLVCASFLLPLSGLLFPAPTLPSFDDSDLVPPHPLPERGPCYQHQRNIFRVARRRLPCRIRPVCLLPLRSSALSWLIGRITDLSPSSLGLSLSSTRPERLPTTLDRSSSRARVASKSRTQTLRPFLFRPSCPIYSSLKVIADPILFQLVPSSSRSCSLTLLASLGKLSLSISSRSIDRMLDLQLTLEPLLFLPPPDSDSLSTSHLSPPPLTPSSPPRPFSPRSRRPSRTSPSLSNFLSTPPTLPNFISDLSPELLQL
jgi:hypothetical protein